MKFKIKTDDRKEIVKAIEKILGEKSKYQGPPSFAYTIGAFTVDREGYILTEDEEAGEMMQTKLAEEGLNEDGVDTLDISFPLKGMDTDKIINLVFMTYSRQYLLNKTCEKEIFYISSALIDEIEKSESISSKDIEKLMKRTECKGLNINIEKELIIFEGLPATPDVFKAYSRLFEAMIKSARELKRVNHKEVIEENEKYYFRSWLVRIGLGGGSDKEIRKILLQNLKGHTAFRTEADKEKWKEKNQIRKEGK